MMRGIRIHSRNLTRQVSKVKSLSHGDHIWFLFGFISSSPLGFFSPLLPHFFFPSSFFFLLSPPSHLLIPSIDHLPLPPGGPMHLLLCLVCSPSEAAWMALPSLAAEVLTPPRLSIYCHSSSHDRWPFIFVSMSSSCLGLFHSNSPDSRLGSPSSVNFLLHVVEGVGGGRLLGIP